MHIACEYCAGHTNNCSRRNTHNCANNHTHEGTNNCTNADLRCSAPLVTDVIHDSEGYSPYCGALPIFPKRG